MDNDKDFQEYIKTLPPEVQQAINSVDYPRKLQEIVKNNKLMIDQAGKLEAETTLVMAGIEPMDKYTDNLITNVGLSKNQAFIVAHDINESIFKGIRDSLQKMSLQISEDNKIIEEQTKIPERQEIVSGIENPSEITKPSISLSSVKSNGPTPVFHETVDTGVEIRKDNLPEIAPNAILPSVAPETVVAKNFNEPIHLNIPPIQGDIVETKMTQTIATPKQTIISEEKTKLPEKPVRQSGGDPYREVI